MEKDGMQKEVCHSMRRVGFVWLGGGTNDRFICMYQQLRRSRRACSCFLTGARIILHHHIPGATQQVQLRWTLHNFFNLSDYFMDTRPRLKD